MGTFDLCRYYYISWFVYIKKKTCTYLQLITLTACFRCWIDRIPIWCCILVLSSRENGDSFQQGLWGIRTTPVHFCTFSNNEGCASVCQGVIPGWPLLGARPFRQLHYVLTCLQSWLVFSAPSTAFLQGELRPAAVEVSFEEHPGWHSSMRNSEVYFHPKYSNVSHIYCGVTCIIQSVMETGSERADIEKFGIARNGLLS